MLKKIKRSTNVIVSNLSSDNIQYFQHFIQVCFYFLGKETGGAPRPLPLLRHCVSQQIQNNNVTSTLIRFQTKTELFCSVFEKICVHTYCFRIVFARPHYNAVSVLKTLLYSQCACSIELNACAFQYVSPRNWGRIEATW